jgi:hypothetical protein
VFTLFRLANFANIKRASCVHSYIYDDYYFYMLSDYNSQNDQKTIKSHKNIYSFPVACEMHCVNVNEWKGNY